MVRPVDRLADRPDVARHACRRLVVNDHHGLDAAFAILGELRFDRGRIGRMAPVALDDVDLDTPLLGHLPPQ